MIAKERMERIQGYGLTEYEARAYLALLELDIATAREVAAVSRVPRTKIYEVLDELHRKQLVEIIPERPKRYQAVAFESYLDRFEDEYQQMLVQLEKDRDLARRELVPARSREATTTGTFQVVKGRKNVMAKVEEMLEDAKERFHVTTTPAGAKRITYIIADLREAAERGVDVVMSTHGDVCDETDLEGIRHRVLDREAHGTTVVIADGHMLVWHPVPDDTHAFHGDDVAMWTDDIVVVSDLAAFVNPKALLEGAA